MRAAHSSRHTRVMVVNNTIRLRVVAGFSQELAMHCLTTAAFSLALVAPLPALALTGSEIDAAVYDGGDLPDDRSALTAKLQILLDRAGISPGVIDGLKGTMSEGALRAFETQQGLPVDGVLDEQVWTVLGGPHTGSVMKEHVITVEDLEKVIGVELPDDYADLAEMDLLGYARPTEALAERFHMGEDLFVALNPGSTFAVGETILVADPGRSLEGEGRVTRIEVQKRTNRLAAFDVAGSMVADYPVTIGSGSNPSPSGTVEVVALAPDPTYHYDPANFQQGDNTEPLVLPPGPNGPVGSMWIDLSEPSYGLHGTAEPSELVQRASHGCVRLTNWDAQELAALVREGTVVEFVE
jgi:lipoprotein-anchoring transpeptidase ErfK/SrfK